MLRLWFAGAIAAAASLWMCARAEGRAGGPDEAFLEIVVRNESGLPGTMGPLWMGTSANGWDPRGTRCEGHIAAASPEGQLGWWFLLPRAVVDQPGFGFKFTRGSWATVEVDAEGRDIENRALPAIDWSSATADDPVVSIELVVEGFADQGGKRWPAARGRESTVTGTLEVFNVRSPKLDASRTIRVWVPPGYADADNAGRRYPVLYMHDGQNLFDQATAFIGVEWQADEAATKLIEAGRIPPLIIVGIDNRGADRSLEYLPFPAGGPAGEMKSGGANAYLRFLTEELMPYVNSRYRTRTEPEYTAMGGSSLGGVVTLYAAMALDPCPFGAILVESPSLWVGEGRLMELIRQNPRWPDRVYLGMGTREYENEDDNERLVALAREAAALLERQGLGKDRLRLVVDEGAVHSEAAWAERLPGALEFLFGGR